MRLVSDHTVDLGGRSVHVLLRGDLRRDPETGDARFAIVQAEDEIASIGIVVGAGWNGARAFTCTSGPGISLMQEFLGLALFRRDPGGAVRRAARRPVHRHADPHAAMRRDGYAAYASHGDTKHVLLFPEDPTRVLRLRGPCRSTWRTGCKPPVFVLLDLDIGMNDRLCRPFEWDDSAADGPWQGDDLCRRSG